MDMINGRRAPSGGSNEEMRETGAIVLAHLPTTTQAPPPYHPKANVFREPLDCMKIMLEEDGDHSLCWINF